MLRTLLLGAAMAGATVAGATPDPLPASLLDRLRPATEAAMVKSGAGAWRDCIDLLEPVEALAWPQAHDERMAWPLMQLFGCRASLLETQPDAVETLTRFHREQWREARRHGLTLWLRMRQPMTVWALVDRLAGPARADAWLEAEALTPLLQAHEAGDPQAMEELTHLVEALYGRGEWLSRVEALQRRLAQALGAEAPPVLVAARVLAVTHRRAGRADQALALIEPAYQLALKRYPGSELLAWLDSERALVLNRLGRVQEALDGQLRVAAHWEQHRPLDPIRGARAEQNLSRLQLAIGRLDAVAVHAQRAAQWAEEAGTLRSQIHAENLTARMSLAMARLRQGRPGALEALRAELAARQHEAFFLQAESLEELWLAAERQGETPLTAWTREALQIHLERWVQPLQTEALLGELVRARQRPAEAAEARWQAVALGSMGRGPALEALALFDAGDAQAATAPALAVALYKRGCLALHRAGIDVPSAELMRVSFSRFEAPLRRFVTLLLDQGRLAEADQALAFLHEGELDAFERRQAALSGPPALAASEQRWSQEVERVGQELLQKAQALERRLDEQAPLAFPGHSQMSDAKAAQARAGEALARASGLLATPAGQPRAQGGALPPRGTAELGYIVGEQQLDVLVRLSTGEVRHLRLPAPRAPLARQIHQFRQLLERPDSPLPELQRQAQMLHRLVLAPVLARLPAHVRRLQLRSDGVLHYLPFAALHDGRHYMAERFVLSQRGPATRAAATPHTGAPLGLGRMRTDDSAAALPAVARELQALRRWPGSRLGLDGGFSQAVLETGLAQGPAVVHLASHFHLDPGGDAASYLLLGDDSHLSVDTLARLPWRGVRLALLSGCQTGLPVDGQAHPGGLAARLRLAGVDQVLATQWRIGDAAAADWVADFYAGLAGVDLRQARPQAAWLARAQQRWLRQHRGDGRAHPHYWAAYAWFD